MGMFSRHHRAKRIDNIRASVGLGRRHAPDPRDHDHLMRRVVAPVPISTRYWSMFVSPLDQGALPQCVAYAWTGMLFAAPLTHPTSGFGNVAAFTSALYNRAQQLDEWPGEGYDGTSVRAGAKALVEQKRLSAEYLWAFDAKTVRDFVLTRGCVVFGTDWYEEMFAPDKDGYLIPKGEIAGGHAYVIIGYSKIRDAFRVLNSWGRTWGESGRAWIKFGDAQALLMNAGEACSAIETKPV